MTMLTLFLFSSLIPFSICQPIAPITPGVTYGSLSSFSWNYYQYTLSSAALFNATRVDLSVVRLSGNTDMYVTLDGSLPSVTNFAYASTALTGRDTVVVVAGQGPAAGGACGSGGEGQPCKITVGLATGLFSSSYMLVVSLATGPPSPILPGIPRTDWLPAGAYAFYALTSTSSAAPRFTFSVTPTSGDPDFFIGTGPSRTHPRASDPGSYCWVGTGTRDVVEVEPPSPSAPGSPCYCSAASPDPPCVYYLGVTAAGGTAAAFTVLGTEDPTGGVVFTTLTDATPVTGGLARGEVSYYTFTFPPKGLTSTARRTLQVVVTPLTGDPDLYIGFAPGTPGPGAGANNSYTSLAYLGPEEVGLGEGDGVWGSPAYPFYPTPGCTLNPATLPCTITLAVSAWSTCEYQVVVYTGGRAETLPPGVTLQGSVPGGGVAWVYYSFTPPGAPGETVVISLQPNFGDPDVYVGTTAQPATARPRNTPGTFLWSSASVGTEVIVIESRDANSCASSSASSSSSTCAYIVGVMGYGASNASFSITARTRDGTPVRLSPGIPVEDVLEAGLFTRYTAPFDWALGFLEVTVVPGSGDPDVYISMDGGGGATPPRLPTPTSFDYASAAAAGDEDILVIPTDAAMRAQCPSGNSSGGASSCLANILVLAYAPSGTASYAITASGGVRVLEDGHTTIGQVPVGKYSYFLLEVGGGGGGGGGLTPIDITLSPLGAQSNPDLFVAVGRYPSRTDATWSSTGLPGALDRVHIDPGQLSRYCPLLASVCRIYIAAAAPPASPTPIHRFTLSATSAGVSTLALGVPVSSPLRQGILTYFSFYLPPGTVPPAWNPAVPNAGSLEFTVSPRGGGGGGGDALLYIGATLDPLSARPLWPTKVCSPPSYPTPTTCPSYTMANSQWNSAGSLSRREVVIPRSHPALSPPPGGRGTTFIVGAYTDDPGAAGGGEVSVTVAWGSGWTTLTSGVPVEGVVTAGGYSFYRIILAQPGDVNVTLTPIVGDPDLYASWHASNPRPGRYPSTSDKSSTASQGPDAVSVAWLEMSECAGTPTLPPTNPVPPGTCTLYIGVLGFTNASYTLVALIGEGTSAVELLDGVPLAGRVPAGGSAYYFVDVDFSGWTPPTGGGGPLLPTYSFSLHSLGGDPDLYVTTDGTLPTLSPPHYQYSSTRGGGGGGGMTTSMWPPAPQGTTPPPGPMPLWWGTRGGHGGGGGGLPPLKSPTPVAAWWRAWGMVCA